MNEITIPFPEGFDAGLVYIGQIHTPWKTIDECPMSGLNSSVPCTIDVDNTYAAALDKIDEFDNLLALYWLHMSRRTVVIQQSTVYADVRGVFAFRTPHRPNPIGVARCVLLKRESTRLTVTGLDCIDGTPLLDIKPFTLGLDRSLSTL